jgi:hypothetical protein
VGRRNRIGTVRISRVEAGSADHAHHRAEQSERDASHDESHVGR